MNSLKKKRIPRSVSIEANVYYRIEAMSERLGVNVNAYLLDAIGQKLFRDESLLRIEDATVKATSDGIDKMILLMQQSSGDIEEKLKP